MQEKDKLYEVLIFLKQKFWAVEIYIKPLTNLMLHKSEQSF